ncbi:MAG: Gfo/Idh/MocA family oxidoreductase [Pseudomonadota bacterium]
MAGVTTRLSVIGAGLIGARHIEIVNRLPETQLASIVDPAPVAQSMAQQHGVPHFGDLAEMLSAQKPDGVIIASPNQLHVEQGLACVAAGVPMLIEKPVGSIAAECDALVSAADRSAVPILVGHHRRHNPLIQAAKAHVASGAIGSVVAVNAMCWLYKPDDYFNVEWRTKTGAGPVFINLIHDVDLLRYLCGEIFAVQAFQSSVARGHEVEDTAAVTLQFASGALGTVTVSDSIVAPWSWEMTAAENPAYPETGQACYLIGGTQGSLEVPTGKVWQQDEPRSWWRALQNGTVESVVQDPLDAQIQHFCRVIARTEPPLVSAAEGVATLRVIEAIKRSALSGGRQDVNLAD